MSLKMDRNDVSHPAYTYSASPTSNACTYIHHATCMHTPYKPCMDNILQHTNVCSRLTIDIVFLQYSIFPYLEVVRLDQIMSNTPSPHAPPTTNAPLATAAYAPAYLVVAGLDHRGKALTGALRKVRYPM